MLHHLCYSARAVTVLIAVVCSAPASEVGENRWEPRIQQFEARDREQRPPLGGVLFIGSSSIVGWDLDRYFPDLPVINRGFGGSQIADSVHFAPRIVFPYKPKTVVLYAGDNDINTGTRIPTVVVAGSAAPVRR